MKWFVAFGVAAGDWLGYFGPYDDEIEALDNVERVEGSGLRRDVVYIRNTSEVRSLTWGK